MTPRATPHLRLSRRQWLVLAASSLSGCGGGTDVAALPGTGGTGIYASGAISGFGSVILGGIKFDDTAASAANRVQVDGATVTSADLRLGMVAEVVGVRSASQPTQGVASSIAVWSIAQGPVTALGADGRFTVAGMDVRVNVNTVLDGINDQTPLAVDTPVKVWGMQTTGSSTAWTATRVAVITDASTVASTGRVSRDDDDDLSINGVRLTGAVAATLETGTWGRVQGTSTGNHSMLVRSFEALQGPTVVPSSDRLLEIEGFVTSALTGGQFQMGQWLVDVSAISPTVSVSVGDKLQVSGTYANGVLSAQSVEREDESVAQTVEIEAAIASYTSISNFTLRGQRCNASGAQMAAGVANQLAVGKKVKIHGTKSGEIVIVRELELSS